MTTTLRPYIVRTTQREVTIMAESLDHAHDLFTGKTWPPGIRPAPKPAEQRMAGDLSHLTEATPEWRTWYREVFLPQRAKYPVLAWEHGECMMGISPVHEDGSHAVSVHQSGKPSRWHVSCIDCGEIGRGEDLRADAIAIAERHAEIGGFG